MWPVLFSFYGIQVQSYGVSKALAALVGAYLLGRAFTRMNYSKDLAYSLVLWATVWGFAFAKVYYILDNWQNLSWHLFGSSGFVWYGGLLGGIAAVVVICRRRALPLGTVAGAMAMPLSVAYGIGRIGCFLAGDGTYGTPTDLPWGMAFPNGVVPVDVPVHPAQLYEALGAFLIAGVLWALGRHWRPVPLFGSYLLLSGVARLLVEFVRVNPPTLLGLTEAQLFGIASVLLGAFLILNDHLRHQTTDSGSAVVSALVASQQTND
ncbi:prolipoprotein diacylglyceryl transferase [Naumannella sp. ID2617S]|nr:prolipoprotein diacylglyceryl transferase [Naumannella sp. ID2617S]